MLNSNPAANSNPFLSGQAFVIPVSGSFHIYLEHCCVSDNEGKLRIGQKKLLVCSLQRGSVWSFAEKTTLEINALLLMFFVWLNRRTFQNLCALFLQNQISKTDKFFPPIEC